MKRIKSQNNILMSKQKPFYKNILLYKIPIAVIGTLLILYFHPTDEVMHCDYYQNCSIERTYFFVFKLKKELKLNKFSEMSCKVQLCGKGKHTSYYGLYLSFDGIKPFVFYVEDSSDYKRLYEYCDDYKKNFQKYINNYGKYQYTIEAKADLFTFIMSILFVIALLSILFWKDKTI